MPTSNVIVTRSGTGFTVDVTACNLLLDTAVKDFIVLHNGTVYPTLSDYTKQSQTSILYSGASLASTTVEVRRLTPETELNIDKPGFLQRLSSVLYKAQQDRWLRRFEEANLNGIGPGSVAVVQTPQNDPFGVIWDGDVTYPPSRNSVYDKFVLMAPLASPTFTGVVIAPTEADATNNTRVATTAFAHTRVSTALSNSPALGGNPTAPTQLASNKSTRIASTQFVNDWYNQRVEVVAYRQAHSGLGINTDVNFLSMVEVVDTQGAFASDGTRSRFTVPATGTYRFQVSVWSGTGAAGCTTHVAYKLNAGATIYAFASSVPAASGIISCSGTWAMPLTLNDTVDFLTFFQVGAGGPITASYSVMIDRFVP